MDPLDRDWFNDPGFWHIPEYLPHLGRPAPDPVHGSARLATKQELEALLQPPRSGGPGLWLEGASVIHTSRRSSRGCDGLYRRTLHLPEELAQRHVLGIGGTGSGKSTRLVIPLFMAAMADPAASAIILCGKADLLGPIYGIARQSGKSVRTLTLSDPSRSAAWNPAADIADRGHAFRIGHRLCYAIDRPRGQDSPFWIGNSEKAIAGILLAESRAKGGHPSLPRVREVLELPVKQMLAYCEEHAHIPQLENFGQYLRGGSHNAETILADAQMRMNSYLDDALCAVTDEKDLEFDELVDEPTVFIVEMDETRLPEHRPTWNLFLAGLIDRLIYRADRMPGGRLPRPTWLFVDEFGSIGALPNFEVRLNTLRSRRVGVVAAVQTLGQLALTYGPGADAVLAGFSTKVFFAGLERSDMEYASRLGGTTTIEASLPSSRHGDRETYYVPRRLLTPEDIGRPPRHPLLGCPTTVFPPDLHPFQAWWTPCYELPVWRDLLRDAPARLPRDRARENGPLHYARADSARAPEARPATVEATGKTGSGSRPSAAECLEPWEAMLRTLKERRVVSLGPWIWELPDAPDDARFRKAIRLAGARLGAPRSGRQARRLWSRLVSSSGADLRVFFQVAQRLVAAFATWKEYAAAHARLDTPEPLTAYYYMEFLKRQAKEEDEEG